MFRAYVDTSVFGGVFDDEFKVASIAFFEQVRRGRFKLLISDVTQAEIRMAPVHVVAFFNQMLGQMQLIPIDNEIIRLREAYLSAGIIGPKWLDDATQVAAAAVAGADLIVSWNFRHIVHFDKIRRYNEINVRHGYDSVDIRSPREVIGDEAEEGL